MGRQAYNLATRVIRPDRADVDVDEIGEEVSLGENPVIEGPEDGVLTITMSKTRRLNAADTRLHRELAEIRRIADDDPEVNCAVVKGAGKGFSAGGDLDLVTRMAEHFDVRARVWREARDLVYNLINCSTPIVSAMHGPAVGSGLGGGAQF